MMLFSPSPPPTLVYAARFYNPHPKVRTYSHLYLWRVGQTGRGTLLATDTNDDTDPQAAPDGKTVFFIRHHDKKPPTVCAIHLQTGKVRPVFSGVSPDDLLGNLQVSPSGQNVLVEHAVFTGKMVKYLYGQWLVIPVAKTHKVVPREIWRSRTNNNASKETKAAWASTEEVLLLHLNTQDLNTQDRYRGGAVMEAVSLAAPNAPRPVPVEADYYTLETDLSPDRRFLLNQPYDANNEKVPFSSASLVRVADGQTIAKWSVAPNERLHWLTARLLLTDAEPLHGDTSGAFLLGTPWHWGNKGVRFRINAQTGQATLWSMCFTPHPSPNGAYFWSQPGTNFAEIGKRPNGTRMTEAAWSLYVASYANPARLIPVASGAAYVNGADWLPARKPKP